jgi:hypothetical protein
VAESLARAARISMKYLGEMLLRLKARACRDIDQRETGRDICSMVRVCQGGGSKS